MNYLLEVDSTCFSPCVAISNWMLMLGTDFRSFLLLWFIMVLRVHCGSCIAIQCCNVQTNSTIRILYFTWKEILLTVYMYMVVWKIKRKINLSNVDLSLLLNMYCWKCFTWWRSLSPLVLPSLANWHSPTTESVRNKFL